MELLYAPMEGITTYTYRNTHREIFGGCDYYYAPFITPVENEKLNHKNLRDILPVNNEGTPLKVQVLTNNLNAYLKFENEVIPLGYNEVNLNFGCPSGTVVKKNRGSGFLRDTEELDRFLNEVYMNTGLKVSVKTRIGFYDVSEWQELMDIYNKYPLSALIVHPRTRQMLYNGYPHTESFDMCYEKSANPLCYNGNVFSVSDYEKIKEKYPGLSSVMIGRGAVANPAIFREIKGGDGLKTSELIEFSNLLQERYYKILGCEHYTLHKLKEIWIYMVQNFPEETKIAKEIKKSNTLKDLNNAVNKLSDL